MPRQALETSPALARLLRQRRRELGLSLRAVEQRASIPFSTLARIEQGRVDPGVKRLHTLLRLYHLPMHMAGDVLDLEEVAEDRPLGRDAETLYREGLDHWKRGDTRKGLAHLLALRERVHGDPSAEVLRQKALLSFAIAAGSLGKRRLSLEIAQDLLLLPPDPSLLVNVLILAGVTWNGLGCPEAALAFLGRAASHVGENDHQRAGWIEAERARALGAQRRFEAARERLEGSLRAFRAARDAYGESKALGLRVWLLEESGDLGAALEAARDARHLAERHGFERLRSFRRLDEGRLLVRSAQREAGLAALNEALAAVVALDDRRGQFHAHHELCRAHESLGNRERAEIERGAARYFSRFVDEPFDAMGGGYGAGVEMEEERR